MGIQIYNSCYIVQVSSYKAKFLRWSMHNFKGLGFEGKGWLFTCPQHQGHGSCKATTNPHPHPTALFHNGPLPDQPPPPVTLYHDYISGTFGGRGHHCASNFLGLSLIYVGVCDPKRKSFNVCTANKNRSYTCPQACIRSRNV